MKGPSEKGDQFAVFEYMKGGRMVTHPCAPLPRIEFFIQSLVSKPNICRLRILHYLCQFGCEPEIFIFPRLSCVCIHLEMWAEVKVHSYHARAHVCVGICICCAQATPLSKLQ